jgi:hypothetical protein
LHIHKCFFGLQDMEYLGYIVSAGKIFVSTKKVEAIAKEGSQFRASLELLSQVHP